MSTSDHSYKVTERYGAGKGRLLELLADVADPGRCRRTVYLSPASAALLLDPPHGGPIARAGEPDTLPGLADVVRQVGETETGLALFWRPDRAIAVVPPFPLDVDLHAEGAETAHLVALLRRDLLVGVILLRLGRYAVGVLQGDVLAASKSGARYVKSRHRAGGSSQRRFERSRERLVHELFDKACRVAADTLAPFQHRLDYLLLGGERHTLQRFVQRCGFARQLAPVTLGRRLEVARPGQDALLRIHHEVWKGRVLILGRAGR